MSPQDETPQAPVAEELSVAESPPATPFPVVGVGASAGGLEAFRQMLEHLPADPGMAIVYVQHLDRSAKSLLPELVGRVSRMPVHEATEGIPVEVNHVYLIPPNMEIALVDGRLGLTPRPSRPAPHMPADYLFRSLADIQKSRAIGIVLSGGGSDGTLGLQAIKEVGGITFAQDERSARHDNMPRSAISSGYVDYILTPPEIARQLLALARHPYSSQPDPARATPEGEGTINEILSLLRASSNVDFTQYKRTTISRRIRRRMALLGTESLTDYLDYLRRSPAELERLYQDFLIRVTRFFRDEEVFDTLRDVVFPALVRERAPNSPIRIWVAGCSTGEEVYSLAIALLEFLGERHSNLPVKILASDVNEAALERARAGIYVDNIELDVSSERLRRFFAKVDGQYQISKAVRDLCVFSRHNLVTDPPFSRLDLVSCRNVLIYLDAALQKRVLPVLHYALNPGGYLVLGSSETIGSFGDLFNPVDQKHRIYKKNAAVRAGLGLDFSGFAEITGMLGRPTRSGSGQAAWSALDVQKEADRVVLARYAPVGVVIDENMTVLQFRGRTGPYLEPAPGMASLDILKMVREGLLAEVRTLINRAKSENVAVKRERIPFRERDAMHLVDVEVVPIRVPPAGVRCFLVLFADSHPAPEPPAPGAPRDTPTGAAYVALEQQVAQLQNELAATREYLQSLVEEHESACEELKSASEELLSANEELQSTNEELQTAKEETQSANEELATLNDELHHRNAELAQANNDLLNLLAAVNIPIVLVSRDLRIRRFTPMGERVFNLIPTDVGRRISDIKPNLTVSDLASMITRVIDNLSPWEGETKDREGNWYSLRIRPYVTLDNKIEGASIVLVDINALRRSIERGEAPAPKGGPEPPAEASS